MDINLIKDENIKEKMLFMKKFVKCPRTIGSIAPSSSYLTESILSNVKWGEAKTIVELGAGTGVFTRQIISKMGHDSKLFIFEIEPELRSRLQSEIQMKVYSDATNLQQILEYQGIKQIDLVISSLPYTILPREMTDCIIRGIVRSMNTDGTFLAYQYSLQMKARFDKIFKNVKIRFVTLNIPPAFVYECTGLRISKGEVI
jgi:phospholipid N-methyltransferase